ncbi:MAG: helicase C-terminal domain-containing protein [Verrucomicrobiota bacterium JB022]|nr:helicase C-terminal domain-containing protein [Verrucomicrobiota bacterium JB022]
MPKHPARADNAPMQVDWEARRVRLSVRELANFALGPGSGGEGYAGRGRAEIGRQWHQTLQERAVQTQAAAKAEVRPEVTINGLWSESGWTFDLQGRIDLVVRDEAGETLREIKTVRRPLPEDPTALREVYPGYFTQLAAYLELQAVVSPAAFERRGELVFVDIDEGLSQTVRLLPEDHDRFHRQVRQLAEFLEARWQRRVELREIALQPPFPDWRPGQPEARAGLAEAAMRDRLLFFQAPTGFGKTGLALDFALEALASGRCDRVIYLTGKSTGQWQTTAQLARMRPAGTEGFRFYQLRNQAEHDPEGRWQGRRDPDLWASRWRERGTAIDALLHAGTLTLEEVQRLGNQWEIPPYELSRALLPFCEVWLGDYNYVFSPRHSRIFTEQPGFDPRQTLLLIDEAHNLASRVASGWSRRLRAEDISILAAELQLQGASRPIVQCLHELEDWLRGLDAVERLPPESLAELRQLMAKCSERLSQTWLLAEVLTPFALELLGEIEGTYQTLERPTLTILEWAPEKGHLRLDCLNAAPEIAQTLRQYQQAVLMSATLEPRDLTCRGLGLPADSGYWIEAEAPWREGAYTIAVDTRVDTRYKSRARGYGLTAETLIEMTTGGPLLPVVAFFPSYAYAEAIKREVQAREPHLTVVIPPRGQPLGELTNFLELALLNAHLLLLVLGSGLSEGIDLLGGRVERAVVVGPALPEVNPVQQARLEAAETGLDRAEAFREVYLLPALLKVNQALGRLVRGPGQHAAVLLQCQRFAAPAYQNLLAPAYRGGAVIRRPQDWREWLQGLE